MKRIDYVITKMMILIMGTVFLSSCSEDAEDLVAPTFTSTSTATFLEDGSGVAYTATVNEPATFTLGTSKDESLFAIANDNEISFVTAPDFENPTDGDQDNVYVIDVIATDGSNNEATLEVSITVTNVAGDVTHYFLGIEAATDPATDVLSAASSIMEGTISPVNNGFEQQSWMTFLQGPDQILVTGYTSAPEFVSYEIQNGELVQGDNFFLEDTPYAFDFVDESTLVLVSSPRSGTSDKTIYLIDTDGMSISSSVKTNFGDLEGLLAFPTDMKVRGDKLFISYYHIDAAGNFTTPASNVARIAVFNYPSLEFDKLIEDDRTSNIGRYFSTNSLEIDENGDIYTYSSSSLACGYAPVPENNSAILRIKNGETKFDQDFYIDFEALTGGYKVNDFFYVGNGKAVVRAVLEDETNAQFLWATYAPTGTIPLLETGILDLNTQTFTMLADVPRGGGGWNAAHLVEGNLLYLGVSASDFASIYVIDTEAGTAELGATVNGNYAKAILSLTE